MLIQPSRGGILGLVDPVDAWFITLGTVDFRLWQSFAAIILRRHSPHIHRPHRYHFFHLGPLDQTVHIKCIIIWLSVPLPLVTTLANSPLGLSHIQVIFSLL